MPSSVIWSERHVLHKQGVIGIMLAMLLFVIGFSVPAWTTSQFGLWLRCSDGECTTNVYSYSAVWMHIVRGIESVALLAFVLCALVEILQDFYLCEPPSHRNKTVEILAFIAGFLGITGAAIFGIQWSNEASDNTDLSDTMNEDHHRNSNLNWGFALVVSATIIALLSAVAIGYSRCRHPQPTAINKTMPACSPAPGRSGFAAGNISFGDNHDVDTSSMMLVPAGHYFDAKSSPSPRHWGKDPPPYALPPPYPYTSNYDFFLPMANSSGVPQISGTSSRIGDHHSSSNRANANLHSDPSLSFPASTDAGFSTPAHSFGLSTSSPYAHHRPMMRQLFVTTSDGGSQIEITPSAQNSTGLPSPYNRF